MIHDASDVAVELYGLAFVCICKPVRIGAVLLQQCAEVFVLLWRDDAFLLFDLFLLFFGFIREGVVGDYDLFIREEEGSVIEISHSSDRYRADGRAFAFSVEC